MSKAVVIGLAVLAVIFIITTMPFWYLFGTGAACLGSYSAGRKGITLRAEQKRLNP